MSYESQAIYIPLKKIIDFDNPSSTLQSMEKKWTTFLSEIPNPEPSVIKNKLLNDMFEDFDDTMYSYVYMHANNIIRKVENKAIFLMMLSNQ